MLHSLFLLDFEILENGKFVPSYSEGSIYQAINEVVEMLQSTINLSDLNIVYITKK